jgi:hypothetical protein
VLSCSIRIPNVLLVVGIPTPLKNDGQLVSWDDDIPNIYIYMVI